MACITGYTNGVYSYIDCCGVARVGVSSGETVCLNQSYSGSVVNIVINTGSTCTSNCIDLPVIGYFFTVTGTCDSPTGKVVINPVGGYPPYTVDPIYPIGHGLSTKTGTTEITYTGLSATTYVFRLNDSLGYQNAETYINISVGTCNEGNIIDVNGTNCGLTNGYLTVSGTSLFPPYDLLLYKNESLLLIEKAEIFPYTFTELDEGIYSVLISDASITTAKTENVVISASTEINFGLWKVDTSRCLLDTGKLAVTGITGVGPYTYLWSNGQTGQTITGLTIGEYSLTVTDSKGCSLTKSSYVGSAEELGIGLIYSEQPNCFASDGEISITLTGGTVPFYYSASSGNFGVTLSDTFTISGLPSGDYSILVKDANFCSLSVLTTLNAVNGFRDVRNVITNSVCNKNNASLKTTITGLYGFYLYSLSGQNTNIVYEEYTQNQNATFSNLVSDTYLLKISGQSSNCLYTETIEISAVNKFNLTATTTPSSCGSPNGSIYVEVGTGYTAPLDYVLSNGQNLIDVPFSSYTFNYLIPGDYILQVTDSENCTVSLNLNIPLSGSLSSTLTKTECKNANDGVATVTIFEGTPPFTYNWSDNTPSGSTGSTVTGLSGGTYDVTITDGNGCTNYWPFTITCNQILVSGRTRYNIFNKSFINTSGTRRTISKMLNEGFVDLTTGYTNCILNTAVLNAVFTINGSATTQNFIYADDGAWQRAVETILSGIPQVTSYTVNVLNNVLIIICDCDQMGNNFFKLELSITYDISCDQIKTPTPTPTMTSTPTPTPTISPTPTATPTPTPTPAGFTWYNNGEYYNTADEDICIDSGCNVRLYTTGSTINLGNIVYTNPTLTTKYVGTNLDPKNGGWARIYLSNSCPITARNVVQVDGDGIIITKYTC
jgi:hypothetical protein